MNVWDFYCLLYNGEKISFEKSPLRNVFKQNCLTGKSYIAEQYAKLSHLRVSSTDLKVRTTLYSKTISTTGKYCSIAVICMVTLESFMHWLKSETHTVQWNKQYHRKVLLNNFHLDCDT